MTLMPASALRTSRLSVLTHVAQANPGLLLTGVLMFLLPLTHTLPLWPVVLGVLAISLLQQNWAKDQLVLPRALAIQALALLSGFAAAVTTQDCLTAFATVMGMILFETLQGRRKYFI